MLVEAVNWTSIPTEFDFKESSIPSAYARDRFIRLQDDANELAVTCLAEECVFMDIISGRRSGQRTRQRGEVESVPISSQTVIETKRKE
jgi:hypothetical protein